MGGPGCLLEFEGREGILTAVGLVCLSVCSLYGCRRKGVVSFTVGVAHFVGALWTEASPSSVFRSSRDAAVALSRFFWIMFFRNPLPLSLPRVSSRVCVLCVCILPRIFILLF